MKVLYDGFYGEVEKDKSKYEHIVECKYCKSKLELADEDLTVGEYREISWNSIICEWYYKTKRDRGMFYDCPICNNSWEAKLNEE